MPIVGGGKVLVMEEDKPLRNLLSQMLELLDMSLNLHGTVMKQLNGIKRKWLQGKPLMWSSWT